MTTGKRILVLGATGTIGRATVRALLARGHEIVCLVRDAAKAAKQLGKVKLRSCDLGDRAAIGDAFRGDTFDCIVSCLASRTGTARDAWAVDYQAQSNVLSIARERGVKQMVLLSAICVQRPKLEFQRAKLAFEQELIASGLCWTIVRPTAFFKSLSGQVERVRAGKPFLVFGDGTLTACKPISDDDLAAYIAGCVDDETRHRRILPIGGPGPAMTPKEQGALLFEALGREPKFAHVPVGFLKVIQRALSILGTFSGKLADKAELAGIGLYYATESMLLLDPLTGRYDAGATPETGSERLADHYARLARGEASDDRGDHAVF